MREDSFSQRKSSLGSVLGVGTILVGLVMGGGAFVYTFLTYSALVQETESLNPQIQSVHTTIANINEQVDELVGDNSSAGSLVYVNDKGDGVQRVDYSLVYPSNWELTESEDENIYTAEIRFMDSFLQFSQVAVQGAACEFVDDVDDFETELVLGPYVLLEESSKYEFEVEGVDSTFILGKDLQSSKDVETYYLCEDVEGVPNIDTSLGLVQFNLSEDDPPSLYEQVKSIFETINII